ncbi:restriction endonuclease subunit S [Escherichia coli]|uniref:restriction endonuclease subunit S n=1 Tax=Enterobacterales TaxID=91347 RepID=UPI00024180FD|nr:MULTISPECIES: restriction endonuclease subunit S [Enterobacterales]EIX9312892.1 restriction endonuclease subunit S [Klebsiella pneumoniae]EKK7720070.1 restriction endonuclease subunit S [Cronobacter sakazakii]MEB7016438.1 restriction endonuclease subunit S [Escherichia coli]CCF08515.1 type I restriction modification DNA specificity domain protein [Pantoea ananatis LMG 5342]
MISTNSGNWIELKIGDVADVVAGGTPKSGNADNFEEPGTGIAWLTPADLSGYTEKYISFGARDLSRQGYDSSSAKILPKGSLLFSSRAPIGYVAIAQNEISTNQGFKNFVFPYGVDSDYAYYYLRSIKGVAESMGTGTTFKEISGAIAKTLPFVLPPLAEQKIIADKLDVLLTQVETTKKRLELIPGILKRFRQSILTAAVSGKLTEGWRERNSLTPPKVTWTSALEIANAFEIPQQWIGVSLGSVSNRVSVGHVGKTSEFYTNEKDGIPFLRSQNVRPGKISTEGLAYITPEFHRSLKKSQLKPGDLLVVRVGANRGDACILPSMFSEVNCANIVFARPMNGLSKYLNIYFQSPISQSLLLGETVGGAQGVINTKSIEGTFLALPPIEEQAEIVHRVEELFTYAETIEQNFSTALAQVNGLTQSILAKAFRGELTADWRSANSELISGDNSAENLLKKIKTEREAIKRRSKPKKNDVKKKTGSHMSKQIIKVVEALKQAGEPLSGQHLLAAAGYPSDSSTDQLEQFFLDIRDALYIEKSIIKLERDDDGQDWFALTEIVEKSKA